MRHPQHGTDAHRMASNVQMIVHTLCTAAGIDDVLGPKAISAAAAKGVNELRNLVVLMRNAARYLPLPTVMQLLETAGRYKKFCNKTASYDHAYVVQLRNYLGMPDSWLERSEDGMAELEAVAAAAAALSSTADESLSQHVIRLNGTTHTRPAGSSGGLVVEVVGPDGATAAAATAAIADRSAATANGRTPPAGQQPAAAQPSPASLVDRSAAGNTSSPPALYSVAAGGDDGPELPTLRAFLEHVALVRDSWFCVKALHSPEAGDWLNSICGTRCLLTAQGAADG